LRSFRLKVVKQSPESLLSAAQALTLRLLDLRQSKPIPVVLIDGRAGSGKSTFARLLQDQVFQETKQSPKVIHMDDLYPGWEGLAQGSLYLVENILKPLRIAGKAQWQRWDWANDNRGGQDPGNGWREFGGENMLIIEGCGSVTTQSAELANLTIWIEAERQMRKERFEARDRGVFSNFWNSWSAQEDEFFQEQRSEQLCELKVNN
jgi:energy-coupling factor transporter ATP-binding protein EcfA2